jgi:hypothetical protein
MHVYKKLVFVTLIALAASCTFAPELSQDKYWPCGPGGECPTDCRCLDGKVCIPEMDGLDPEDCQWCAYGHMDCDLDPKNGCEVNVLADPENCSYCEITCPAGWLCELGTCVHDCRPGLVQCDQGCVDTQSDPNNCGGCGETCRLSQVCDLGVCTGDCGPGRKDCHDGSCAELESDPTNCGECGVLCTFPNARPACELGMCQIGECIHPFGNCDRHIDGCEADLKTSLDHCGECGNACGINMNCLGGTCVCNDYYADCDENPETGCEIMVKTDPKNCGECGVVCDEPPVDFCEENFLMVHPRLGECAEWECAYEPVPTECTFGCELGACLGDPCEGMVCDEGEVCVNGICSCGATGPDCHSDQTCCGTECVSLYDNPEHCGFCFFDCGSDAHCTNGMCFCDEWWGNCNQSWSDGCETYLYESHDNCGDCGHSCGQNAVCISSYCACQPGYDNCDAGWDNGCEVDVTTPQHCGSCGISCSTGELCCNGTCTNLQEDDLNCGTCGHDCPGMEICCGAECINPMSSSEHCGRCNNTCVADRPCDLGSCGSVGVDCADGNFCDPFQGEMCCLSPGGGMNCNVANDCTAYMFDCDGPEDCDLNFVCCAVMASMEATACMPAMDCPTTILCNSDLQCQESNPNTPFCCPESIQEVGIHVCMETCY